MDPAELLALAADAATYDSIVVLWVTPRGTQPVLMPRSLGRRTSLRPAVSWPLGGGPAAAPSGGSMQVMPEDEPAGDGERPGNRGE